MLQSTGSQRVGQDLVTEQQLEKSLGKNHSIVLQNFRKVGVPGIGALRGTQDWWGPISFDAFSVL